MNRVAQLGVALKETFSRAEGWIAAVGGFVVVMALALILSNLNLLGFILREEAFDWGLKTKSVFETLWQSRIAFMREGGFVTLVLALLFGMNAALITRYMRRQARLHRAAGASTLGVVVGLLGVGCAACGSALFASLLGAGGLLALLPLHGREFSWIGAALILFSLFSIARRLVEPEACVRPDSTLS